MRAVRRVFLEVLGWALVIGGVAALVLQPVTTAAIRHASPLGWCLEIRLAEGQSAGELVRGRPFAEFLDDLRLLGMHPRVLALELEL